MKKNLSILMIFSLLITFFPHAEAFSDIHIGDSTYLQNMQDDIFALTEVNLASDDIRVEEVHARYISQDYIEELAFNSQANIYFGYTLSEVETMLGGNRFIFTLGSNHKTEVVEFTSYDSFSDFPKIIKNIAIGAGIILICITISVLTKGVATPKALQFLYAVSANASRGALTASTIDMTISGISSAIASWNETQDFEQTIMSSFEGLSEGFKFGAIGGALIGGITGGIQFANSKIPTWRDSEQHVLERINNSQTAQTQIAFKDKVIASTFDTETTRPDIIISKGATYEAIEIKNYNLVNNKNQLIKELKRQIGDRVNKLPDNYSQRVILDVRGRGYTQHFVDNIISEIQQACADLYKDIPIDAIWF